MINSTVFRNIVTNDSSGDGGGIFNESGTLMVTNSTISRNIVLGGRGGGIVTNVPGPANSVNIKSSIIASNFVQGFGPDVIGPFTSAGFNLIGKTDGSSGFTQPTDQTGTVAAPLDPGFETDSFGLPFLKDNGRPTHTIALLSTSPAIDKGTANGLTGTLATDQRGPGFPRTVDNPAVAPATGGDDTDIGAFELAPPPVAAGNALQINESCPPANGAIDPGERVTVYLNLTNNGSASTSNLVATLQSSGGVVSPSGPQSYGVIAPGATAGRDFTLTADPALNCGGTLMATLQLQDGATNLGTVTYSFTLGVNSGGGFVCTTPCGGVRLVVKSSLSRTSSTTVQANITIENIGTLPADNTMLTTANLGSNSGTPVPQALGNIAPGGSSSVVVNFSNSIGGASTLTVGGMFSGGTFSSTRRVTVPQTCTPGAPGCGWAAGDMVTYNRDSWGSTSTTAGTTLNNYFDAVYPGGGVEIGVSGAAGFSAIFTSATAVFNYQPADGVAGPLDNDLQDPVSTSSGIFGGHVLAVQLDVDFSDANRISGSANLRFGDLRVCALTPTPTFNNLTVRQVLGELNSALGGNPTPYSYDDLAVLASDLSSAFEGGSVSLFAQQHLFNAATCP